MIPEYLNTKRQVIIFIVTSVNVFLKELSEEDQKIRKFQEFQARQSKRERRPKRKRAYDETNDDKKGKSKGKLTTHIYNSLNQNTFLT